jgi:hypothetical protein
VVGFSLILINNAIIAYYDYADTVGEQNTIAFYYTIENEINYDYSINYIDNILLYANLNRQ